MTTDKTAGQKFDIDHYVTVTQDIISYTLLFLGMTVVSLAVSSVVYFGWF